MYKSELRKSGTPAPETHNFLFQEALDRAAAATKSKSAVAGTEKVTHAEPVVIRYCEQRGIALNRPEIRAEVVQGGRFRLPWQQWLVAETTSELAVRDSQKACAIMVQQLMHRQAQAVSSDMPIDVQWDPDAKSTVVVTTEPAVAGSIKLFPCVPITLKMRDDSTHPDRVYITCLLYTSPSPRD